MILPYIARHNDPRVCGYYRVINLAEEYEENSSTYITVIIPSLQFIKLH